MAKNYVSDAVVINSSTYDSVQFFDDKTRLAFYDAFILSGLMDETVYSGVSAADAFITLKTGKKAGKITHMMKNSLLKKYWC